MSSDDGWQDVEDGGWQDVKDDTTAVGVVETAGEMLKSVPGWLGGGLAYGSTLVNTFDSKAAKAVREGTSKTIDDFVNKYTPDLDRPEEVQGHQEWLTKWMDRIKAKGGDVGEELGSWIDMPSEGRLVGGTLTDALVEIGPPAGAGKAFGAGLKDIKGRVTGTKKPAPVDPHTAKLDEMLAKPEEAPPVAPEAPQLRPEDVPQQQQTLFDSDVDLSQTRNPYDVGGDVSRQKQGMNPLLEDTTVSPAQKDLFTPDRESFRPEQVDQYSMKTPDELLSLTAKENYPVNDGGVRHFDRSTGKVVQGMDASVPTIDFPLRQEVLERPEVQAVVNRMKERLKEATTDQVRQKVENDFVGYMRKYGVEDAAGATGLRRALYEGTMRDPMAIRKSGELELRKSEMTDVPVIDETGVSAAFIRAKRKGQGGFINKELFTGPGKALVKAIHDGYTLLTKTHPATRGNEPSITVRVMKDGKQVGGAHFKPDATPGSLEARNLNGHIAIDEAHQKKGIGTALYDYIEGLGNNVKASRGQTKAGQALTQSRAARSQRGGAEGTWDPGQVREDLLAKLRGKVLEPHPPKQPRPLDRPMRQGRLSEADANLALWNRKATAWKQGGAINLEEISEGISKIAQAIRGIMKDPSKSKAPEALGDHQRAAFSNIPGMEGIESYISKDIPNEVIKAKILAGTPATGARHWAVGGKEMIASILNQPAIYWLGSKLTNSSKRADLYHKEILAPVAKELLAVVHGEQGGLLAKAMKAEMFHKQRLTGTQLREFGLNDKTVSAYYKLRTEFDVALDTLNKYRAETNQKPIKPMEAYLSSRWNGDWKTPVYNKDGKLVWYIAETSKGRAEHALNWLKEQNPDLDISKSKVGYSKDFYMAEETHTMATLTDMIDILGREDPAVQSMIAAESLRAKSEGESMLGHTKHMEPKAGIRGFLGDRPWVNDAVNTRDLFKSQMTYLSNTHRWVETQGALRDINKIIGDPEIQAKDPNLVKVMQNLKKAEMGHGTIRWISQMERSLSKGVSEFLSLAGDAIPPLKHIPTDLSSVNRGLGMSKSYFYISTLGILNYPFAAMSLVQPVFTIGHHFDLSHAGYTHNPMKTTADSFVGGIGYVIDDGKYLKGMQKEAANYMKANGIGDLNQFTEAHDIGHSPAYHAGKEIAGWSMTASEKVSRAVAFMGYVSHLEQSGKFKGDHMSLFQKAEELTDKSMANYRHTERADMFNKLGITGSAASALNTFKVNMFSQLYDFGKKAQTGNYKPLLAMMTTQFLTGGALGMYAIDEIDDLYNYFKNAAVEMGMMQDPDMISWSPKHQIAKNLPDWVTHGAFSQVMENRNYGSRMSAGNVVDLSFAGLFPFLGDFSKKISAMTGLVGAAVRGEALKGPATKAAYEMAPSSIKPIVELYSPMTNAQGDPISKDRKNIEYRRTPEDLNAKQGFGFGFGGLQSVPEHKAREEKYRDTVAKQLISKSRSMIVDKFATAVADGNMEVASKAMAQYARMTGDSKKLDTDAVQKAKLQRFFTADEWQVYEAKSMAQLMELARSRRFRVR